ncbi:MAG: ParB/RepB/Spo0J family partition protein [Candidatus Gastranaerophilales bacterium]|nr:ParB/RepB/Spo0J family partition protein [Candidatus Gastranaerophilales bacterium]
MSRGMKSSAKNIQMTSYEDLFQVSENGGSDGEKVQEIALTELFPFRDHPFKVLDDEAMTDTVESVKTHGVLVPGIARPRAEGGYELVSGHRRKRASELAGLETMPVIVREMDDDEAVLMMVDSNLQRENILPSEKAWAYRMKLEALKHQGVKDTSRQLGEKYSIDELSANSNDSARNIHRFIRLTELEPAMLQMVDDKKLPFNPAVELSYLTQEEQVKLSEKMAELSHVPSLEQAKRLRKFSQEGKLGEDVIEAILTEERKPPPQVTLKGERLRQYFSEEYTQKQIEDVIISLLETWKKEHN